MFFLTASIQHLYPLISDLGLILMTAGLAALLFKKIKQPLVLGYLIAGFLFGKHFDFFPSVKDIKSVEVWAEIGVIFLLFSLGLEFSFKKLMKVGGSASLTAITQIVVMVILGYSVGRLMGWNQMNCIFLGVILSVSSTTIILKTFDELGVKTQKFAGIVIGTLIVQDLLAILMLVLLSTIAVSQQFSGIELFQSVLRLVFFLIIWFVGGIFFIPTLLKKAKELLTDEMLLILSLALCLMMVIFATNVGFSPALGAFVMGSIIAETTQAEHIEHLVKPVKDLFGAVFFVSVGMLIDPNALIDYAFPVLLLTLVTIFGQSISSTIGALISGQPLKQSVQTGMSLAQIGEFSFIIATLGMTLGVTSSFLYPIVVAVSAVTTFTTPFMIRLAVPFSELLEEKLPRKWVRNIDLYSSNTEAIKSVNHWHIVLKAYFSQILLFAAIIAAIILICSKFALPMVTNIQFGRVFLALFTLILISPFLWALSWRRVATEQVDILKKERKYRGPLMMMIIFRLLLSLFFIGFLLNTFFSPKFALISLFVVVFLYSLDPKKFKKQYHTIEEHFLKNFNDREVTFSKRRHSNLTPWDGHMTTFDIPKECNFAGKTLRELKLRERLGINIAFIKRGEITIKIPEKEDRLFPGDEICIIGTDQQVEDFKHFLERNEITSNKSFEESEIVLEQIILNDEAFIGKNIRESLLREKTRGLVVGIERGGKRLLNPDSDIILAKDDILWIVGDRNRILVLFKK